MLVYLSLFLLLCTCSGVVSSFLTTRESSRCNIRQGKLSQCYSPTSSSQHIASVHTKDEAAVSYDSMISYPAGHSKTFLNSIESVLDLRAGAYSPLLTNDVALTASLVIEVFIWLKLWTTLASKGVLPSTLTRKIIHSGSAPLFMMHWPLYADTSFAPLVASVIPLLQILRLYTAGSKVSTDKQAPAELIAAVSRTGRNEEALGGPLIYSVVLLLCTALFFRSSTLGVIAISQMAAGDGVADIIGRKYGKVKWPFAKSKSIVGSVAFVIGGFACSLAVLSWLHYTGYLATDPLAASQIMSLFAVSVLCAAVELIPGIDDNISVPIAAILFSWLFMR